MSTRIQNLINASLATQQVVLDVLVAIAPAKRSEVVATLTAKDYSAQPTIAIIATSTANFTFQLDNDTVDRTIPVIAGTKYDMRVDTIDAASVATVLALFDT